MALLSFIYIAAWHCQDGCRVTRLDKQRLLLPEVSVSPTGSLQIVQIAASCLVFSLLKFSDTDSPLCSLHHPCCCNLHSVRHLAAGLQGTEGTGSYLQYLQAKVKLYTPAQPWRSRSSSLFWPYSGQINSTVESAQRSHWPFSAAGWKHIISETTPTRHANTQ